MLNLYDEEKTKILAYAKWVALIGLPALATLWLALSGTWGVNPILAQRIGSTLTSIDVFLGTILGVSEQKNTQNIMTNIQDAQQKILDTTNISIDTDKRDNNENN